MNTKTEEPAEAKEAEGYDEQNPDSQPILDDGPSQDDSEPNETEDSEQHEAEDSEQEGTSEAQDQLNKIQNQLLVVREKESAVEGLKEDLKFAKADCDNATEKLLQLVAASVNDENRPLFNQDQNCLLYTSPSPRDATLSRMPSSA